jgi:2,4-dienoyl-CoA reductase-like NADH-dependent reductase (Old Yellow Enzyme family)
MAEGDGLAHVLAPITIRNVTIPNRVVRTAHGTNIGQGRISDDLIAYHLARARGGVGLTIIEAASVHWTDTGTLRLHDESCVEDAARLMDAVRPTGMRVFAQLGHLGHEGVPMRAGERPWSASEVPSLTNGGTSHAMTLGEIDELIACFAQAARWMVDGGVDGIEVHAAHGYLLQGFLSPSTNRRTDHYGGSFENRLRLTVEVLGAVRAAVGGDVVVGVRTGAEADEAGMLAEDCADVVAALGETGLIDYVNVTFGSCRAAHKIIGAMHEPTGYELPTSEVVTKATTLPTIVTGRFRTLADADEVIRAGLADLVGMTRAHIADPDLVAKTRAGRAHEVRPCIACNQGCVGGLSLGRMACAVNADVGFERVHEDAYEPVALPRRVLVVGAGPAGLEAARVAARRGHRVTLCEAADSVGGNLRWSRRFPHRDAIGEIVDWLAAELDRLGVELHCGTAVDDAGLRDLDPEVLILATGAERVRPDGAWSSIEIAALEAAPPGVASAVVVDRFGSYEVLGVAERLVGWGIDVTVVTPLPMLAMRALRELVVAPALERLAGGPGRFLARTGVDPGEPLPEADLVVVIEPAARAHGLTALDGVEVHVVGDAREPGHLWAAIRSGNAAGRAV